MPHIQIKLYKGRTEEQKQQLATEVMKAAQKIIGSEDKSYSVAIEDYLPEELKKTISTLPHFVKMAKRMVL